MFELNKKIIPNPILLFVILILFSRPVFSQDTFSELSDISEEPELSDECIDLIEQGNLLSDGHNYNEENLFLAINNYKLALENCPESYLPYYHLGELYLTEKLYVLAEYYLKISLEKVNPLLENEIITLEFYYALSLAKQDKYDQAIPIYEGLIGRNISSNAPELGYVELETLHNLGWIMYKKKDMEKTIALANRGIALATALLGESGILTMYLATYHNILGCAYSWQGDFDRAVEEYNKMTDYTYSSGNDMTMYNNLGETYRSMFEYEKSLDNFLKVVRNIADNNLIPPEGTVLSYVNLADLMINYMQFDNAVRVLENFLEISNAGTAYYDKGLAYLYLGKAHYFKGDFEKSFEYLDAAKNFPQYLSSFGILPQQYDYQVDFYLGRVYESIANTAFHGKIKLREKLKTFFYCLYCLFMSWWYNYKSADLILNSTDLIDSIKIYRIDGNVDYFMLPYTLASYDEDKIQQVLQSAMEEERDEKYREHAEYFYKYYINSIELINNGTIENCNNLESLLQNISVDEQLLAVNMLSLLIDKYDNESLDLKFSRYKNILFEINPGYFRGTGYRLDVKFEHTDNLTSDNEEIKDDVKKIIESFPINIYEQGSIDSNNILRWGIECKITGSQGNHQIELKFYDLESNILITQELIEISKNDDIFDKLSQIGLDFCNNIFHIE